MGNVCCDKNIKFIFINETFPLSKIEEAKNNFENVTKNNDIINNDDKNSNNIKDKIIEYQLNSKFNIKEETVNGEQKIKNKNTIKNINRKSYLVKKYKFADDKIEKHIKFTHFNKIISSTTNSFIK